MNDVLLLYLFTRLDIILKLLILMNAISCLMSVILIWRTWYCGTIVPNSSSPSMLAAEKTAQAQYQPTKQWAARVTTVFVASLLLTVAIPNRTDMAIIVGGKIALDASRTDTAKEIGSEVLNAIRAQLRKTAAQ